MILVDTSVWIDHLHRRVPALVEALEAEQVLVHPFVLGELACGQLRHRQEFLGSLAALPAAPVATDEEVLELIEKRRLMGRGVGYVDVHLLASALLGFETTILTSDRLLRQVAVDLRLTVR